MRKGIVYLQTFLTPWRRLARLAAMGAASVVLFAGMVVGLQGQAKDPAAAQTAEVQRQADQGDATAEFMLGLIYSHGMGLAKNYEQAALWYRKAADQGYAKAQYQLGVLYESGQGVKQDLPQAISLYRKAAAQGDEDAEYYLGVLYGSGKGVTKDEAQAVSWYRKAADHGYADAELNLGVM